MKPEGCIYPDCLNCTFNDCIYDDLEEIDIVESKILDKEIVNERSKQHAIEKGKISQFNYENSEKGKERARRYCKSQKGKNRFKRYKEKNKKSKKKSFKTIIKWLDDRSLYYRYESETNIIKIGRWKIRVKDGLYLAGKLKCKTQKDVINNFLVPHYYGKYKGLK